uniref:Maco-A 94/2 86 n=1 Tax=Mamestra configurata nucleopolyhedrovirus TaxID=207830 RepID=A0A7G7Y945_NPVMC|nr:maco-A 94/2 86 [Mamestra configurata nucleopolyhedrovirus A]QNH90891.1 maco-A-Ls 80 [Mamestra configurata nucleopolyhedrovirus A]
MSHTCKTCGGSDHTRKSSKKCKKYLPPIRKRHLEDAKTELELYTVKRGLVSILCPLLDPEKKLKLLTEIRRDVRDLSRVYIELGIWINYYMKTAAQVPPKPDILNFFYAMKGKGPYSDAYRAMFGAKKYDDKLRSFVVQEMAKQYETVLHTNISTHAYARLARYFKVKRNNPALYSAFFKKDFPKDNEEMRQICTIINADTVKGTKWWSTIPEWLKIQSKLEDFKLFPQPSHGLKHLTYTSRGWHELIRRVDPKSITCYWARIVDHRRDLWAPWLNVDMKKFGCSLQTDGNSVSLSMNRFKKPTKDSKRAKKSYARIIAVDPGSRIPIAAVESQRFHFWRITKKFVRSHTLEWKRERVRSKLCQFSEEAEQNARAKLDFPVSSKNTKHVIEYTVFRMTWFNVRQEPYEKHLKLTRLKLDKYIRVAKCEEKIIKHVFDGKGSTLVLYGAGSQFINTASFSGRKFKHDSLIKRLRSKRNIDVEIVDESYTSQACSSCNKNTGEFTKIVMNNKLRWGICPNCHSEFDRDANAAKNILINYTRSTICRPGCSSNGAS